MQVPRPEYPRPDFVREEWMNLNGEWEFDFDDADEGLGRKWQNGRVLSRRITVPFCYQSPASGVHLPQEEHEVLWYARNFTLPQGYGPRRILLHFGAVDYMAQVWVDGQYAGGHLGGYTPFTLDITDALAEGPAHRLCVRVKDTPSCIQPRGKQTWKGKPFTCWYTPVSGIWQTVWLEPVQEQRLEWVRLTPDLDRSEVRVEAYLARPAGDTILEFAIALQGEGPEAVQRCTVAAPRGKTLVKAVLPVCEPCNVDRVHYWTPETPNLYDCGILLREGGVRQDSVLCYFGMRKVDIRDGVVRLNNAPLFQRLVLDQGYWPEGIYTAPTDDAIRKDVETTKEMGFNGARKHQKIEDPRYYYWADRLGLLVWGETPSAFEFCAREVEALADTAAAFIARDYNHPCIICWVPFNESWGVRNIGEDPAQQQAARALYHWIKALDGTRLVVANDGWEQVDSDLCTIHDYTAWAEELAPGYRDIATLSSANGVQMLYARGHGYGGQPVIISEYGGVALDKDREGHNWGYGGQAADRQEYVRRLRNITQGFCAYPYVQGYCYTQLTDVYQEVNGLLDFHRNPKVSLEEIRSIHAGR